MKKNYSAIILEITDTPDVVATSQYVETEKVLFGTGAEPTQASISSASGILGNYDI